MGNKGTKEQVDQLLQLTDSKSASPTTKADLVGCLASIADMANTGHGTALPHGAPPSGASASPPTPPEGLLKMNTKLRRRLESLKGTSEDVEMIESLMKLEDSADWAHMRNWLVWCMHSNLDESGSDDSPPVSDHRRRLKRQTSMDVVKSRLLPQSNIDVNPRDERMSAQSSMESNAET